MKVIPGKECAQQKECQKELESNMPRGGWGGGGGVLRIFVYGGVHMEGKIQTQKHRFPENFAPKNIGILHISYPKIWVKIVF